MRKLEEIWSLILKETKYKVHKLIRKNETGRSMDVEGEGTRRCIGSKAT